MSNLVASPISEFVAELLDGEIEAAALAYGEVLVPDITTPVASQVQSYARSVCRLWARTPAIDENGRILGIGNFCTPYLQSINEDPTPGSFEDRPEVPGGQCEGEGYLVTVGGDTPQNGFQSAQVAVFGPIDGLISTPNPIFPGFGQPFVQARNSAGNPQNYGVLGSAVRNEVILGIITWDVAGGFPTGGDPFLCGTGGGPTYTPPTPRPNLPALPAPPNFPTPFGDRPVSIDFRPDGCVEIDAGDGVVVVCTPGAGGSGNGAPQPPITSDPVNGPAGGGPADQPQVFEEPPPGQRWMGVLIEITTDPIFSDRIFSLSGQAAFYKAFGSAQISFETADGTEGNLQYEQIVSTSTLLKLPIAGASVTGFRCQTRPGFSYTARAVAEPLCPCS